MDTEINHPLKLLAKSSLIVFVGLIFSKFFTYIYKIIIARYFGPEIYGLFSLVLIIFLWVGAFASLGLSEGILRYIPFYRGKKELNKIKYILRFSIIVLIFSSIL